MSSQRKTPVSGAIGLPACPDCRALAGDPCRTSGNRTRGPHARRLNGMKRPPESTLADVRRAKAAFDEHRDRQEALGVEVCLVVVGYASGREPFRLLGRVDADTGLDAMPDPPLTMAEMQPVAFAAKIALAKVLIARRKKKEKKKT